jgi:hypothetical protein
MNLLTVVAAMFLLQTQEPKSEAKPEPPKPQGLAIESGDWKLKFYGFLRLDMIYDDSKANDPQIIQWVRSEDPTAPAAIGAEKNDAQFNMHPKLTRFGLDVAGPTIDALGSAKVSGKIEVDFYNSTTSESRAALRMRHAYLKLAWDETAVFAGQREDVISPLMPIVNNDMVMWNAGNLGDRRPQLRFEYTPKMGDGQVFVQASIGLTGANDAQNLETPGVIGTVSTFDGVDSGLPTFQVRVAYKGAHLWVDKKTWEIGFWGHVAQEELSENSAPINGEDSWDSQAFGVDLTLPIFDGLDLQAEIWTGTNLDDVRGGIGQGVNVSAGDPDLGQEIDSSGGWIQLGYQATGSWTFYAGYSYDDPDDGLAASAARDKNSVVYIANRIKTGPMTFGIDYLNWTTEWSGGFDDGVDNRFNAFAQFNF